jgi:serine/threonine-protein kinase
MATPFGKYALQRKLAEGGMAELFLARQGGSEQIDGFEKLVVLKRILPALSMQQEFIHMFLNEARVAARLNHPNIVQLFDLGKVEELYFIAMEYVHGEDLREIGLRLEGAHQRMPMQLACRVIADTLAGLHYAHTRAGADGKPLGLVHRDISPANVLVTYEGTVKLCDFGIAKATLATAEQTQAGLFKGKFAYMSPEQSKGQPLDARSDVFSAGILLWELLCGQRLFKRENDMQILMAVSQDAIRPPRMWRPEVPPELDRIVMKALDRVIDQRYPSAQEMRVDLEALIRDQKWEADALALQRWMRELFAEKLKAQAADIHAAGLASLDDFLLTVEQHTSISWMPQPKTGSNKTPEPVSTMYDDEKPTELSPPRRVSPKPVLSGAEGPAQMDAMPDAIPTVVLASDLPALPPLPEPGPTRITESQPGNPAFASTAPMGWQQYPAASTAKRPAYDPPSRWRRLAVIITIAVVAAGGALTILLWPQHEPEATPSVIAPPVLTVPEPKPAPPPPAPPKPVPPPPATATLEIKLDRPAAITVDGTPYPFGRIATVVVTANQAHVVGAQRPGHSVHKVNVPAPMPGDHVPLVLKLK